MSSWSSFCHWHPLSITYLYAVTLFLSARSFAPRVGLGVSTSISQAGADLPITAGTKPFPEPEEELEASRIQFSVITWWCLGFVRVCGAHKVP